MRKSARKTFTKIQCIFVLRKLYRKLRNTKQFTIIIITNIFILKTSKN